jgi:porphobilinogen deaminase
MPRKTSAKDVGAINIRDVPKELLHRVKLAATAERRSVKGFLLALTEARIEEMEKNGLLPKGK